MASFPEIATITATTAMLVISMTGVCFSAFAKDHSRRSLIGPALGTISITAFMFFVLGVYASGSALGELSSVTQASLSICLLGAVVGGIVAIPLGLQYKNKEA